MEQQAVIQAWVLKRTPWKNTSLSLQVLTRNHGRFSVIINGARAGGKKGEIGPQLFGLINLTIRGSTDLKNGSYQGADSAVWFANPQELNCLAQATLWLQAFVPIHQPCIELYEGFGILRDTLKANQSSQKLSEPERIIQRKMTTLKFGLELIKFSGGLPNPVQDGDGKPWVATSNYIFEAETGWVACRSGRQGYSAQTIVELLAEGKLVSAAHRSACYQMIQIQRESLKE